MFELSLEKAGEKLPHNEFVRAICTKIVFGRDGNDGQRDSADDASESENRAPAVPRDRIADFRSRQAGNEKTDGQRTDDPFQGPPGVGNDGAGELPSDDRCCPR